MTDSCWFPRNGGLAPLLVLLGLGAAPASAWAQSSGAPSGPGASERVPGDPVGPSSTSDDAVETREDAPPPADDPAPNPSSSSTLPSPGTAPNEAPAETPQSPPPTSLGGPPATPASVSAARSSVAESPAAQSPAVPPPPVPSPPVPPPPVPSPSSQEAAAPPPEPAKEHFFDRIHVRGYTQIRYNELGATNERLVNLQGDKSMGGHHGFFFRRARLVLQGKLHEQVHMYLQTDFASAPVSDSLNFVQMRDWYFDLSDPSTEFRIRVGQSKVPFGFENMQSSSNRIPFDRSDAINSALSNERDIGLFFYYAPREVRRRFKELTESGLKGSGDYGMVGLGVFNGQTSNRPERNANKHVIARVSYPFRFGKQYVEIGGAGYVGKFVIQKDAGVTGPDEFQDARIGGHFVLYPQPFGLQVEYNGGIGPELFAPTVLPPEGTPFTGVVRERGLHGGYVLASFKLDDFIPYARAMYYEGGKKHEKNAPKYSVRELEVGVEWRIIKALELTGAYAIADRTFGAPPYNQESGRLFRFQLQINY